MMVGSITRSSCISVNAFWFQQNGNALFDLSGYIAAGGFNAHIWVSVPGIIGRNRLRLDMQEVGKETSFL